jgi:hypothetical protein
MMIVLFDMAGGHIAQAPITTDKHGYLYVNHPTFEFEFECALYGYQEGGVSTDTIDNDDGEPYIRWVVEA